MRNETVLRQARFDPKLPSYWMASTILGLIFTVFGIVLIPFLLMFGWGFFKKRYDVLECTLTERTLHIKRGVIFKSEKNIPLDKIQDIGMTEGPLLRRLGLASLRIETAGQSAAQGAADAQLVGVIDAPGFRDAILDQRDRVAGGGAVAAPAPAEGTEASTRTDGVLIEIRDSLQRIEGLLTRDRDGRS